MKPPWVLHEQRIAYHTGGKRVAGSGCGWRKGDVWIGKDWMIECKTTRRPYFNLTVQTLDKLAQQSLQSGLSAALVMVFHEGYSSFKHVVYVLERRGEFHPTWRSKRITPTEPPGTLESRQARWQLMSWQEFLEECADDHAG